MTQRDTGLRRLLGLPSLYQGFQDLLGAQRFQRRFVRQWVRAEPGMRVLDIGCGPAAVLDHLPAGVEYHGFDESPTYIAAARQRHGERGRFWQARVERQAMAAPPADPLLAGQRGAGPGNPLSGLGRFDRVIAIGVLHHLDDDAAGALLDLAAGVLAPGGALVTYDPCLVARQPRISRFLVEHDRGADVRTADGYAALARTAFTGVAVEVISGHLRVPYHATVMTCRTPESWLTAR